MAVSFLSLAFTKTFQPVRVSRRDRDRLAIDVVMLGPEVAVLRRQVLRPALRRADRALLAGLSLLLERRRRGRFLGQRETPPRWHRDPTRRKGILAHRPGRPSILSGTGAIIVGLAREIPT
jgi:hypothetical protein